jgi:uncharacterized protein YndB with AHSA1/START domain
VVNTHAATVLFSQPPEVVFPYLADPRRRPEWQSSLKAIEMRDQGEPRVGMRWRDLTGPGFRPEMEITQLVPYRVWAETGSWRGVTAHLTLRFTAVGTGTRVNAEVEIISEGLWRAVSAVVRRLAPAALAHDLEKANEVLSQRRTG